MLGWSGANAPSISESIANLCPYQMSLLVAGVGCVFVRRCYLRLLDDLAYRVRAPVSGAPCAVFGLARISVGHVNYTRHLF